MITLSGFHCILCCIIIIIFVSSILYLLISFFPTFSILSGREESTSGQLFVVKFGKSKKMEKFFFSQNFLLILLTLSKFAFVHLEQITNKKKINTFFLPRQKMKSSQTKNSVWFQSQIFIFTFPIHQFKHLIRVKFAALGPTVYPTPLVI